MSLYEFRRIRHVPKDAIHFSLNNGKVTTEGKKITLSFDFDGNEEGAVAYMQERIKNWEGNFYGITGE